MDPGFHATSAFASCVLRVSLCPSPGDWAEVRKCPCRLALSRLTLWLLWPPLLLKQPTSCSQHLVWKPCYGYLSWLGIKTNLYSGSTCIQDPSHSSPQQVAKLSFRLSLSPHVCSLQSLGSKTAPGSHYNRENRRETPLRIFLLDISVEGHPVTSWFLESLWLEIVCVFQINWTEKKGGTLLY